MYLTAHAIQTPFVDRQQDSSCPFLHQNELNNLGEQDFASTVEGLIIQKRCFNLNHKVARNLEKWMYVHETEYSEDRGADNRCLCRVRSLKFATYLKFAASGNANKINELI